MVITIRPYLRMDKGVYRVPARPFVTDSTDAGLPSTAFLAFRAAFFFAALDFALARAPSKSAHKDTVKCR